MAVSKVVTESSAAMTPPFAISKAFEPRAVISVQVCEAVWQGTPAYMFVSPLRVIAPLLVAPVSIRRRGIALKQVLREGWSRDLSGRREPSRVQPVVLSTRNNWTVTESQTFVYNSAFVVDGAARVEAQLQSDQDAPMMFVALPGLTEEQEVQLRLDITSKAASPIAPVFKVDTEAPRTIIGTQWRILSIESEPFVVPTVRGYAPALLVRAEGAMHAEHLLIGAKSLAIPIEALRTSNGKLTGISLRVRKLSDAATAAYEVVAE